MGIDVIFEEQARHAIIANINSIDGKVVDQSAADEQSADHTAGGKQGCLDKKLRHNAASLHANRGEDADLARSFEDCHDQRIRHHCCGDTQYDQIEHDHEHTRKIFELGDERVLVAPGEHLKI